MNPEKTVLCTGMLNLSIERVGREYHVVINEKGTLGERRVVEDDWTRKPMTIVEPVKAVVRFSGSGAYDAACEYAKSVLADYNAIGGVVRNWRADEQRALEAQLAAIIMEAKREQERAADAVREFLRQDAAMFEG